MNHQENSKILTKVIAKAWADEGYKEGLIKDPKAVLAKEGIRVPDGVDLKVVEATDTQAWLLLPQKPAANTNTEETDERLAAFGYIGF